MTGEAAIQRAILEWLAWKHILAFRVNSGKVLVNYGGEGSTRMIKLAPPGTADIIGITPDGTGRLLAIECKTRKGKQTPEQVEFEQRVTEQGGIYILARGVEDIERIIGG